jgi:hypothetical protein
MWTVAAGNSAALVIAALIGLTAAWWFARGRAAAGRGDTDTDA